MVEDKYQEMGQDCDVLCQEKRERKVVFELMIWPIN
jgi:hypothetical protein